MRSFIKRLLFVAIVGVLCLSQSQGAFICFCNAGGGPKGFPGQSGNPVGFAATPASAPASFTAANGQIWPGAYSSLTAWPGGTGSQTISSGTHATSGSGTSGDPYIFAFYDFNAGTGATTITVSNAIFVGCRFQSNDTGNVNVQIGTGSNVTFIYSSFVPLVSLAPTMPNAAWPSAGAGLGIVPTSSNVSSYMISGSDGYQYGVTVSPSGGPYTWDHCDMWGFANAWNLVSATTATILIQDTWIHDARNPATLSDHTDGPGYLNAATPPINVQIKHCTIASIGNTNALAFQGGTSNFTGYVIDSNYLSGFGNPIFLGNTSGSGIFASSSFTNNVLGSDLPWVNSPTHGDLSTVFGENGNTWRNNTFNVLAGTSPASGSTPSWTSANNGQYLLPNGTFSSTDF